MGIEIIIGVLAASLASLIASLFSALTAKKRKAREEYLKALYLTKFEDLWATSKDIEIGKLREDINYKQDKQYLNFFKDYLSTDFKNIQQRIIFIPSDVSKEEIELKVKQKVDEIKKRIEEIEKRFPAEGTLEKIASVNDAILATNIESLTDSIKKIEERILTKWDIAKVVFQIIAALGVVIGLVFGILQYFKGS